MWFDLGVLLDVPFDKLREIKFSTSKDHCIQVFTEWLNSNPDATWGYLLKVINEISFDVLIGDLISEYKENSKHYNSCIVID